MRHANRQWLFVVGLAALIAASLAANPATQPFRSAEDVERAFAARSNAALREYREQIGAARRERIDALKVLLDRAMEGKKLDAAIQLRDQIKTAEAELQAEGSASLDKGPLENDRRTLEGLLKDTTWGWGTEEKVKLSADGTVEKADWTAWGLRTTWKVVDRRTVLFSLDGRGHNRNAVLTFSSDFRTYSGVNFDGKPLPTNRKKSS